MNIRDIIGKKIAVHCDTEEKANKFSRQCGIILKWNMLIEQLTHYNNWGKYKDKTCYQLDDGVWYGDIEYFIDRKYKIVEFDDISFED